MSRSTIPARARGPIKEQAIRNDTRMARSYLINAAKRADELGHVAVHKQLMASLAELDEARVGLGE